MNLDNIIQNLSKPKEQISKIKEEINIFLENVDKLYKTIISSENQIQLNMRIVYFFQELYQKKLNSIMLETTKT